MSLTLDAPATLGPPPLPRAGRAGHPWLTLLAASLAVIMVGLDGSVVAIANPFIGRDLHASLADLQWVTNAYLLALAVLLIVGGKLGDRFGRKRVFLVGVAGFALTSVGVGLVGSIPGVIAFRAAQGAFGALLMPNTLALLRAAFPPHKLNQAVGIWGGSSAIATAAGPIIGGLFVEHISWESVFYLNAPLGALTVAIGLAVLGESRERVRQAFDPAGVLTLAGGLFAVVFGLVQAQSWSWGSGRTLGLLLGGLALLAAFVVIERRSAHPMLPLRIFRDRSVSVSTVAVLLNFFALMGVLFFVALYLQSVHGDSAVRAGVRTLPLMVTFAVSSPLGAALTSKLGPRVPITAGMVLIGGALLGLTGLQAHSSYLHLWPPFVALGLGVGMVVVASTDAIVGNIAVDDAGIAGGLQSTAMQLGGVLGTAVLGSVLASRVGAVLVGDLTDAGVPAALAQRLSAGQQLVGQGLAPVPPGTPHPLARAITEGSHTAFMSGLHTAMVVGAVVAFVGAALAPFIRRGRGGGGLPALG